jgi:4-hydroxybenzoate polyprenyltransferase
MLTAIELTRVTMAAGAISDLWLVILITRADDAYSYLPAYRLPLAGVLAVGAVLALALFAFGGALNDLLDARHDRAFSPHRPIPAGQVRSGQAAVVTLGALLVAMVASSAFGSAGIVLTALAAAGILAYDAAGKHIPALGLFTIGLVHAVHMLVPNHQLTFTLPVWMVMTHATAIATALYLLERKRPPLTPRAIAAVAVCWLAASVAILGASWWQAAPEGFWPAGLTPLSLAWPLAAVAGFLLLLRHKLRGAGRQAAAEKLRRYASIWQIVYAVAWLLALGLRGEALGMAAFAAAAVLGMIAIRELTALLARPLEYRR